MPIIHHISSIACPFLSDLVVAGPEGPCLSVISSLSPSLAEKNMIFLLNIYSLMSPLRIIRYPLFFQDMTSFDKSDRNTDLGNSLLLIFKK